MQEQGGIGPWKRKYRNRRTKRTPRDDEGRGWSDAAASQELPRIASHHQKLERGKGGVCLESQREQSPTDTLTLNF